MYIRRRFYAISSWKEGSSTLFSAFRSPLFLFSLFSNTTKIRNSSDHVAVRASGLRLHEYSMPRWTANPDPTAGHCLLHCWLPPSRDFPRRSFNFRALQPLPCSCCCNPAAHSSPSSFSLEFFLIRYFACVCHLQFEPNDAAKSLLFSVLKCITWWLYLVVVPPSSPYTSNRPQRAESHHATDAIFVLIGPARWAYSQSHTMKLLDGTW